MNILDLYRLVVAAMAAQNANAGITTCPSAETSYTAADGSVWAICPGTDYSGTTATQITKINSVQACAQLCDNTANCVKAVYQPSALICHIKSGTVNWTVNSAYSAIRLVSNPSTTVKTICTTSNYGAINYTKCSLATMTIYPSTTSTTTSKTTTPAAASTSSTTVKSTTTTTPVSSSTSSTSKVSTSTSASSSTTTSSSTSSASSATSSSSTSAVSSVSSSSSSASSASTSGSSSKSPDATSSYTLTTTTSGMGSVNTSTTSASTPSASSGIVNSQILIIARDYSAAAGAIKPLKGYGIPYYVLLVPQTGATLPQLNSSTGGNFGGIIIPQQVSYDYGNGNYSSALTQDQWNTLYAYQIAYGVRMVQYDVYPGPNYGTTALGGCCGDGVEQLLSFSDVSAFPQAGIRTGAGVTTQGLYHYPATITDPSTTQEFAQFAASAGFGLSSAGVINNFNGRQQMVFFISFSTDWSSTSNFLTHAYVTWMTRGLYAGIRRVNFATQIDDMMLPTDIYYPSGTAYRVTPNDMSAVAKWVTDIQRRMVVSNPGSFYLPEIGYNGNGNILQAEVILASNAATAGSTACSPGAVDTGSRNDTALEFQKPLGTGTDAWAASLTVFPYSISCMNLDPLKVWFDTNKESFMHISHTFSHYELNNSTYSDALKEIQFNQAWFQKAGFTAAKYFSSGGLIPPAITGLHNGDVLRAWTNAGLNNCVGDNTRPPLRNTKSDMYPYITNVANNGFDGYTVIPRWATRIYYNCDTPICTLTEFIKTSGGSPSATFTDLLGFEKADTMRHLFGLYHDGFMFHQANLRVTGLDAININGVSTQLSIFQAWVEVVVQEFSRLVNWPMITLKQDDLGKSFVARMNRDSCNYRMTWQTSQSTITGVTLTADSNTCSSPIPVTVPGPVTDTQGFTTEKVGNDPLTIWVQLTGNPVSFTLSTPIAF